MDRRGVKYKTRTALSVNEYWQKLKGKLIEEAEEFRSSDGDPKELADILEVIDEICAFKNLSKKKIQKLQEEKAKKRGKFNKRIILIEAE